MADYGSVGLSLGASEDVTVINPLHQIGVLADVIESSIAGTFQFYTDVPLESEGAKELNLASIIRVAQPWKGEGTVVEYLYIGGGISVY